MAEEKKEAAAAPEAKKPDEPKKKGGKTGLIILMTVFGASVWFILPSLLLLIGMAPTLIELFLGDDRKGSSVVTVGVMNVAGIVPFLIELWQKGQTMENSMMILSQSETWIVMCGSAAIGWLILFSVPQAIASMTVARAETRIKLLKENMERLKTTWGPDVATVKSLEKVARGE